MILYRDVAHQLWRYCTRQLRCTRLHDHVSTCPSLQYGSSAYLRARERNRRVRTSVAGVVLKASHVTSKDLGLRFGLDGARGDCDWREKDGRLDSMLRRAGMRLRLSVAALAEMAIDGVVGARVAVPVEVGDGGNKMSSSAEVTEGVGDEVNEVSDGDPRP